MMPTPGRQFSQTFQREETPVYQQHFNKTGEQLKKRLKIVRSQSLLLQYKSDPEVQKVAESKMTLCLLCSALRDDHFIHYEGPFEM